MRRAAAHFYTSRKATLLRRAASCRPPMPRLLLTRWLVSSANLPCLLSNAGNLLHCEEARQFDILNSASGYSDAGHSRCHCGISHVENHHHAGTIGSPPVHRDKLTAGG